MAVIQQILNPETMNKIKDNFDTKLKEKLSEKDMTNEQLAEESLKGFEGMMSQFGDNPMLKQMFKSMETQMTQQEPQTNNMFSEPVNQEEEMKQFLEKLQQATDGIDPSDLLALSKNKTG
jgi:hypothetical protein